MIARLGDREPARLAALRSCAILDTRPEADFDDLAAVAAEVAGASIGVVAFVDETRWWAKSRIGAARRRPWDATRSCAARRSTRIRTARFDLRQKTLPGPSGPQIHISKSI